MKGFISGLVDIFLLLTDYNALFEGKQVRSNEE